VLVDPGFVGKGLQKGFNVFARFHLLKDS
jgi:hypothetical protein